MTKKFDLNKYKLREILADWFKHWEYKSLDKEAFDDLIRRIEDD